MSLPAIIHTPEYARAFNLYLRKGVPIELSLKAAAQEHPTTQYIWRTRGDGKVRAAHAANNGRIFSWENPPATGHPGEDFNCRCTAEPYVRGESEYAYQIRTTAVHDSLPKWGKAEFVDHAVRVGTDVTLSQTGHLLEVINHYAYVVKEGGAFERVNKQVIDKAREVRNGDFIYQFSSSYEFKPIAFALGDSVVRGEFNGRVSEQNGLMRIEGKIEYFFEDAYTDPVNIREWLIGTSDPDAVWEFVRRITDGGAMAYKIQGQWSTIFLAEAKLNESESIYQWNAGE